VLLFAFVQQYRKSVTGTSSTAPVFVASQFIPRGTPASVVGSNNLLQRTTIKQSSVLTGAIADPTTINGEVAATDIYPGQQIRALDFTHSSVTLASQLLGTARAIAIPVDPAHGLTGFVQPGDHVDILFSQSGAGTAPGSVTTLAQNVVVLNTAGSGGGGIASGSGAGNVVVRVPDQVASQVAFAVDNGKVWITLRPPVGALAATKTGTKVR
jgi:pilus assembly protein CpaB